MLPAAPEAAPSIAERRSWTGLGAKCPALLKRAEQMLGQPTPELADDLYLEFSRLGTRAGFEQPYRGRLHRLTVFAMAECIENQRRFVAALEEELAQILREKTWVMPANDSRLDNFHGRDIQIDLGASMRGASVATVLSWLGGHLNPSLRERALEELERRLFAPYREAARHPESQKTCYWLKGTSNWNAVCTTGIVVSALAALPRREDRAEIVSLALGHLPCYLEGFTSDGYCSEGLGYWNYGFSHYIALSEWLLRATSGRLDLYQDARIAAIARYPDLLEMFPGSYPAFADCELYLTPLPWLRGLCDHRLGNRPGFEPAVPLLTPESDPQLPYLAAVACFPVTVPSSPDGAPGGESDPLRGWFHEAGVLVCRTGDSASSDRLSACFKGGHNAEHHNHNDVGTFVAAVGGRQLLIDPGKDVYTRDTFGPKRYSSALINSCGHSVPVVAGSLQSEGAQARGSVLDVFFSDDQDRLKLDLTSAYDVPSLKSLVRTFTFQRHGKTELRVTDHFEFSTPQSFEEALITPGKIEQTAEMAWIIREEDAAALVTLESACGWETEIHPLPAQKTVPRFLRLAMRLRTPLEKGTATLTIRIA